MEKFNDTFPNLKNKKNIPIQESLVHEIASNKSFHVPTMHTDEKYLQKDTAKHESLSEIPVYKDLIQNEYSSPYIDKDQKIESSPHHEPSILSSNIYEMQSQEHDEKPVYMKNLTDYKSNYEQINEYQQTIIELADIDLDVPDYTAAYRKLNAERNKLWKLNPSDIADFYLLEPLLQRWSDPRIYREDGENMAYLKARDRVHAIGSRLLTAMTYEQLDEYDRFAVIRPDALPDEIRAKVDGFYRDNAKGMRKKGEESMQSRINYYLSAFKRKLDDHTAEQSTLATPFEDQEMFGTVLEILESQQSGRWRTMATAMRALHDPQLPLDGFIDHFLPEGMDDKEKKKAVAVIENRRETFLIDRLINYVHNTGLMSARVANYFPKAASLLIAHGMPQHERYLFYHSSFANSGDSVARYVRRSLPQEGDRDIVEDLTAAVESGDLPREFEYGLLLEFPHQQVQDVILERRAADRPTPSRVYNLLQRVSHHDGTSKGRLNMAA